MRHFLIHSWERITNYLVTLKNLARCLSSIQYILFSFLSDKFPLIFYLSFLFHCLTQCFLQHYMMNIKIWKFILLSLFTWKFLNEEIFFWGLFFNMYMYKFSLHLNHWFLSVFFYFVHIYCFILCLILFLIVLITYSKFFYSDVCTCIVSAGFLMQLIA